MLIDSAAVDTVGTGILLQRLQTVFRVGRLVEWFRSCMTNRMQNICRDSFMQVGSKEDAVWIPQGFFTQWISPALCMIMVYFLIFMYADQMTPKLMARVTLDRYVTAVRSVLFAWTRCPVS